MGYGTHAFSMRRLVPLAVLGLLAACSSAELVASPVPSAGDAGSEPVPTATSGDDDQSPEPSGRDAGVRSPPDAGKDASKDASEDATTTSPDGTPMRADCTSSFGSGLTGASHGRLDGTLIAIVAPDGTHQCNADSDHLHLQIRMSGSTYDIAINVAGVDVAEKDAPLLDGAWSEGWHPGAALDYPTSLGLHASDFTSIDETPLLQHLEAALATVNHISVFATKYNSGGAHLVHRNGNGNDGALVLRPLAGPAHYIVFHFPNQTF